MADVGVTAMETGGAPAGPALSTDRTHLPVVVLTPGPEPSDEALGQALRAFDEETVGQGAVFGLVLDLREVKHVTARQRQMLTNSMKQHEELGLCRGSALVFGAGYEQDVFSRVFWVRKPTHPTNVFTDLERALRWVESTVMSSMETRLPRRPDTDEALAGWVVQAGASRSLSKAREVMRKLETSGYRPYLHRRGPRDAPMYIVRLGPYTSRHAALSQRASMAGTGIDLSIAHTGDA